MTMQKLSKLSLTVSPLAMIGLLVADLPEGVKLPGVAALLAATATALVLDAAKSKKAETEADAAPYQGRDRRRRLSQGEVWSGHIFRENEITAQEGTYGCFRGEDYLGAHWDRFVPRGMRLPNAQALGLIGVITWRRKIWAADLQGERRTRNRLPSAIPAA